MSTSLCSKNSFGENGNLLKVNERNRYFKHSSRFPRGYENQTPTMTTKTVTARRKGDPDPELYVGGTKVRLCDMGSKYLRVVRIVLGKTQTYLKLTRERSTSLCSENSFVGNGN